eukprot:6293347-Amphidinium_carterae.1
MFLSRKLQRMPATSSNSCFNNPLQQYRNRCQVERLCALEVNLHWKHDSDMVKVLQMYAVCNSLF